MSATSQPAAPSALPQFLTIRELAQTVGVSRQSIYAMIARGTLPKPLRFGRSAVRFIESDVLAAIDVLRVKGGM